MRLFKEKPSSLHQKRESEMVGPPSPGGRESEGGGSRSGVSPSP